MLVDLTPDCTPEETPNGVDNKEIYQHISMAVTGFNIQGLA